ncbi:uncharacterized protein JCM6883_002415 [Sporobolomyces salmoneus]|uniref:uncharacterized protein n=1 Tax=Sporobolomyces salmoneus TaxID=183962 RepID=UPI00317284E3
MLSPPGPTYTRAELDQLGCHKNLIDANEAMIKQMLWVTRNGSFGRWRQAKSVTDYDWTELRAVTLELSRLKLEVISFTTTLVLSDRVVPGPGCARMKEYYGSRTVNDVVDFNHALSISLDGKLVDVDKLKQKGPRMYADRLILAFWMEVSEDRCSARGGWRVQHAILRCLE